MNKRNWLILIFSIAFLQSNAQFSKGDRMVGANVGSVFFNSGKSDYTYPPPTIGTSYNTNQFGVNINPVYGWFVSDHIVVGPSVILTYDRFKAFYTDDATGNTFNSDVTNRFNMGLGAFARNFFKAQGNLQPYAQAGFNLGIGSTSSEGFVFAGQDKTTYNNKASGLFFMNAGIAVGLLKLLSKHTALDFSVAYNFSNTKGDFKRTTSVDAGNNGSIDMTSTSTTNQKFTGHGVILGVGFQVFIEKKKK